MISVANILVDTHRIRLGHDRIDKLNVLRMSKIIMESKLRKEAHASIMFKNSLSNDHVSANE